MTDSRLATRHAGRWTLRREPADWVRDYRRRPRSQRPLTRLHAEMRGLTPGLLRPHRRRVSRHRRHERSDDATGRHDTATDGIEATTDTDTTHTTRHDVDTDTADSTQATTHTAHAPVDDVTPHTTPYPVYRMTPYPAYRMTPYTTPYTTPYPAYTNPQTQRASASTNSGGGLRGLSGRSRDSSAIGAVPHGGRRRRLTRRSRPAARRYGRTRPRGGRRQRPYVVPRCGIKTLIVTTGPPDTASRGISRGILRTPYAVLRIKEVLRSEIKTLTPSRRPRYGRQAMRLGLRRWDPGDVLRLWTSIRGDSGTETRDSRRLDTGWYPELVHDQNSKPGGGDGVLSSEGSGSVSASLVIRTRSRAPEASGSTATPYGDSRCDSQASITRDGGVSPRQQRIRCCARPTDDRLSAQTIGLVAGATAFRRSASAPTSPTRRIGVPTAAAKSGSSAAYTAIQATCVGTSQRRG